MRTPLPGPPGSGSVPLLRAYRSRSSADCAHTSLAKAARAGLANCPHALDTILGASSCARGLRLSLSVGCGNSADSEPPNTAPVELTLRGPIVSGASPPFRSPPRALLSRGGRAATRSATISRRGGSCAPLRRDGYETSLRSKPLGGNPRKLAAGRLPEIARRWKAWRRFAGQLSGSTPLGRSLEAHRWAASSESPLCAPVGAVRPFAHSRHDLSQNGYDTTEPRRAKCGAHTFKQVDSI